MDIRKFLLGVLSFQQYLKLISYVFLRTFTLGIHLKVHKQVKFLGQMVKEGDVCIDIGANLGYFSIPLSRYVGSKGKVYSVEPVPTFRKVLEGNIALFSKKNVAVVPYALGEEDDKEITLSTPIVNGVIRHGRTEVNDGHLLYDEQAFSHPAIMKTPESLFGHLSKLDFIKCDVEGFELHIVPQILFLVKKFHPIIEIEAGPLENKKALINMLAPFNYKVHFLNESNQLIAFDVDNPVHQQNEELYFFPQ